MPRISRRSRVRPRNATTRANTLELLLGPNGKTSFASSDELNAAWIEQSEGLSPNFASRWFASGSPQKKFAETAAAYAIAVTSGEIPTGEKVRLACQRHLDDLHRASWQSAWGYRFDAAKAERICRFAELLPHVKGRWAAAGELIVLRPWQIFILCSLFGWVRGDDGLRRFSLAYIEVGRKNAKSILAAIIGLYMFAADGEFGAEVYSGATKETQAMEVFRPAVQMMERSPELRVALGIDPATKKMTVPADGSRFEVVVRAPGDGSSPHCGIVDEYHEHDSDQLYDTFRTGMGARDQPLTLVITTAGFNMAGPCKLLQGDVAKILEGSIKRDEVFGIIYSIDPGDDWTSEGALRKANPNYGVSVLPEFLKTEQQAAINTARKQGVFKTKHLCIWVGSNSSFFNLQKWIGLGDRSLKPEMFIGNPCVASLDLSTKRDITARILLFRKLKEGKAHFYAFSRFYLPEAEASLPEAQHYRGWATEKFLTTHAGGTIDFDLVEIDTIADLRRFQAKEFAFDPWNAAQFAQGVARETKTVAVEIQQNVKLLSAPMKELDALIADGRVHHDGNPVLTWMIGNVTAHEDANENVFPRKDIGNNKIDGAVALIMALSRLMTGSVAKRSVYATRGVLTLPAAGHA